MWYGEYGEYVNIASMKVLTLITTFIMVHKCVYKCINV